ncbi:hypothetical protein H839_09728 [Parageobacillus genomosp. 1]|uniref:Uncharacterized protein n=1 Tax=Parageobacillus genomosp. 1 TaxID=1295642 RepID=A0ABC9VEU4_9BACL|nr:hypothetical protein [Parageobacillus genomosp. 1]EZP76866.1 hypothetical protein H839_09728 [Parageobacillus genomosp. 1]
MAKTKTKKYTNKHSDKPFTIDDARNFVLKVKKLEGCTESTLRNKKRVHSHLFRHMASGLFLPQCRFKI